MPPSRLRALAAVALSLLLGACQTEESAEQPAGDASTWPDAQAPGRPDAGPRPEADGGSEPRQDPATPAPDAGADGGLLGELDAPASSDASPGGDAQGEAGPGEDAGDGDGTPPGPDADQSADADIAHDADTAHDAGAEDTSPGPAPACQPDFGSADACGGIPVGAWDYGALCTDFDFSRVQFSSCPQATITDVTTSGQGTLQLGADSYARQFALTASMVVNVPASCAATAFSCNVVAGFIQSGIAGATATCAFLPGGGCHCPTTVLREDQHEGTYTAENGVLTTSTGARYYYCVQGDALRLRREQDNQNPIGITEVYTRPAHP